MAKPKTYANRPAKWWKDATDYPEDWKAPVDGQAELDFTEDVAPRDSGIAAVRSGTDTTSP